MTIYWKNGFAWIPFLLDHDVRQNIVFANILEYRSRYTSWPYDKKEKMKK
ncbi:MAG: hypothetical protein ACREBA_03640 [Nitrosotalea sp.]